MELTQSNADVETSNVVVKPPLLFLIFLATGSLANFIYPLWDFNLYVKLGLGSILVFEGVVFLVLAMRRFKMEQTPVSVSQSTRCLVRGGVYARSRNPIYLGMLLAYAGFALLTGNAWLLILMPLLLIVMHVLVIRPEEQYLARRFGVEYSRYRQSVRRWF